MILNILKFLFIVQEIKVEYGYKRRRLNRYNPLTYVFIVVALLVTIIMYGVVGFTKEVDFRNPFKYQ